MYCCLLLVLQNKDWSLTGSCFTNKCSFNTAGSVREHWNKKRKTPLTVRDLCFEVQANLKAMVRVSLWNLDIATHSRNLAELFILAMKKAMTYCGTLFVCVQKHIFKQLLYVLKKLLNCYWASSIQDECTKIIRRFGNLAGFQLGSSRLNNCALNGFALENAKSFSQMYVHI